MEKYYVLQQVNATGNGSTTTTLLVTNPRVENGAIFATKVGIIDSNRSGFVFDEFVFKPDNTKKKGRNIHDINREK